MIVALTDELRNGGTHLAVTDRRAFGEEELTSIADRIDREHRMAMEKVAAEVDALPMTDESMAEHGWIRLPVDADGVPIHVGDRLDGYGKTIEVVELRLRRGGWMLFSRGDYGYVNTFAFVRHHAPTVEDVLREFAQAMNENLGMYTSEAIDADEWREADARTVDEYAAKLRLAEEE